MVMTDFPLTSDICTPQARTASPSRWTVQAPHRATPQPNFVPVRPSSSRKYHRRGIDGSPSNACACPFTRRLTMMSSLFSRLRAVAFTEDRSSTALRSDEMVASWVCCEHRWAPCVRLRRDVRCSGDRNASLERLQGETAHIPAIDRAERWAAAQTGTAILDEREEIASRYAASRGIFCPLPIGRVERDVLRELAFPAVAVGKQTILVVVEFLARLGRELEVRPFDDGIDRAGLLAHAAIDAFHHVDVVARGAPRAVVAARARLDGDRLGRADRLAQLAGDAALLAVGIAAQRVLAAQARREMPLLERIVERGPGLEEEPQSAHEDRHKLLKEPLTS